MQPNTCIVESKAAASSLDHSVVLMNPDHMTTLDLYDDDVVTVKGKRNKEVVAIVKSNATLTENIIQMTDDLRANIRYITSLHTTSLHHHTSHHTTPLRSTPLHFITHFLTVCYCSTRVGQKVSVESFPNIKFAKSIQIAPFEDTVKGINGDLFTDFVKPHFLDQYLPLKLGQKFTCNSNDDEEVESDGVVSSLETSNAGKRFVEFKVTSIETIEEDDDDEDDGTDIEMEREISTKKRESASGNRDLGDYCIVGPDTEIILDTDTLDRSDEDSHLDISYEDIGGCGSQLAKIREVLELPLRHPELFKTLGIAPPKGVLMHGPPGECKYLNIAG